MHLRFHIICLLISLVLARPNAVVMILCRNEELDNIDRAIRTFEQRFNSKFKYPYVFLNDKEFTEEFKAKMQERTNGLAKFGKVEPENWEMPKEIDRGKAMQEWKKMGAKGVPYADRESYHNMCRFFSRSFYKHPLLQSYDYYWRIEPHVQFHCDIDEDPFEYMDTNKKKYGFVIILYEYMNSIPTLMTTTAGFLKNNYDMFANNIARPEFMFDDGKFNGCHFWSNFEIASLSFFRSKEYNAYVDALEQAGGFYYERWGDAPVHSIAAALLLDKSEIHFFENIGYTHNGLTHCPATGKNCDCSVKNSIDFTSYSCLNRYMAERNRK